MKYFIDTEFIEGTQKSIFNKKPTIDLISIGIVCEDGREYYAISKDFNLKEAWNRYDWNTNKDTCDIVKKVYWIRENVLKPIYNELVLHYTSADWYYKNPHLGEKVNDGRWLEFNYKSLKWLINKYGKTNKQIAEEIKDFVLNRPLDLSDLISTENTNIINPNWKNNIQFYGYYSDYDWVVFCWLFGRMIDLPKGFPMYCIDLKQTIDEKALNWTGNLKQTLQIYCDDFDSKLDVIKSCKYYPKQINEHSAIYDARWNHELYKFLNTL